MTLGEYIYIEDHTYKYCHQWIKFTNQASQILFFTLIILILKNIDTISDY